MGGTPPKFRENSAVTKGDAKIILKVTLGSILTSLAIGLTVSSSLGSNHFTMRLTAILSTVIPLVIAPTATFFLLKLQHRIRELEEVQWEHVAKLALIGEMTASVAHEINQPLTSMKLIAQGLQRQTTKGRDESLKKLPEKIDKMLQQIDRAASISSRLRDAARQDSGESKVASPSSVVLSTLEMISPQLQKSEISYEVNVSPELPDVGINSGRLEQVLLNLLANARDAIETSECSDRWIKIDAFNDSQVCITVEDSAGGVPDHLVERIFDSYVTTKPRGKGTGLGLYISKKFILDANGSIAVQNTDGGAKFLIKLPSC
jgi:two-component system NtrC family sensor kinase